MDSLSVPSGSIQTSDTTTAIRSQPQFITVPIAASIATTAPGIQTVRTTLGTQIALKQQVATAPVGTPILIALPKGFNTGTKTISTSSVIAFAPSIPGFTTANLASASTPIAIRSLPAVTTANQETPATGQRIITFTANNGTHKTDVKVGEVTQKKESVLDRNQKQSEVSVKAQHSCDNCGQVFANIGILEQHKVSTEGCSKALKTTALAHSTSSTTGGTRFTIVTSAPSQSPSRTTMVNRSPGRNRQSHGYSKELIKCPYSPCPFATHWVQSLTKHVGYCKLKQDKMKESGSTPTTSGSSSPTKSGSGQVQSASTTAQVLKLTDPVTCAKCQKICNGIQEHIDHMTTVHKMKATYRCSTCAQTFPTKVAVENHLQTHNKLAEISNDIAAKETTAPQASNENKEISSDKNGGLPKVTQSKNSNSRIISSASETAPNIEVAEEDDDGETDTLNEVYKCECGKVYLQKSSFELHTKTCSTHSKTTESKKPLKVPSATNSRHSSVDSAASGKVVVEHFTQDYVQLLHNDDFRCKCCKQEFAGKKNLTIHLNATEACKGWYSSNVIRGIEDQDGRKDPSAVRKRRFSTENDKAAESNPQCSSTPPKRAASIAAQSTLRLSLTGHYVESKEVPGAVYSRPLPPPLECPRCGKVFGGKCPQLSLNNHLRCSKSCTGPTSNKSATMLNTPKEVKLSASPIITPTNMKNGKFSEEQSASNINKVSFEVPQPGVKYYCKLCPNHPIKNRVSLGTHLTIYHGLPPVNIGMTGESFRCQTCQQHFNSKYFYNMHRYECDLTSPYVGVLSEDGEDLHESQGLGSSDLAKGRIDDKRDSEFMCNLCNRGGFSGANALKMHQKYQCRKRSQAPQTPRTLPVPIRPKPPTTGTRRREDDLSYDTVAPKAYHSEIARLNDLAKKDSTLTMCDACGRGPYNSYYYLLEHKRHYCRGLKGKEKEGMSVTVPLSPKTHAAPFTTPEAFTALISEPAHELSGARAIKHIVQKRLNVAKKSMPNSGYVDEALGRKSVSNGDINSIESSSLLEDGVIESNDKSVTCSVCNIELGSIEKFVLHRLKHASSESEDAGNLMKCEICGQRMRSAQRLQQHFILHLQNHNIVHQKDFTEKRKQAQNEDDEIEDEPPLPCPYCKVNFPSRIELADHIRTSCPSRYQCSYCEKIYLAKELLIDHKEECTKRPQNNLATSAPEYKCRSCGLEFRVRQQLLWHEHSCSKVYTAETAVKVKNLLKRAYTCVVCDLTAQNYNAKVKHERRCLNRYLSDVGYLPPSADDTESDLENLCVKNFDDVITDEELDEAAVVQTKSRPGTLRESIVLPACKTVGPGSKQQSKPEDCEGARFKELRRAFWELLRALVNDNDLFEQITQSDPPEVVLNRILRNMGQSPVEANNGLNELTCFSQNVQSFLNVTIKQTTLEKANRNAESIEGVIINLLRFPLELKQ